MSTPYYWKVFLLLPAFFYLIIGCQITPTIESAIKANMTTPESIPFQPVLNGNPTETITVQSAAEPLPKEFAEIKIDGIKSAAEWNKGLNTWVWKDNKGTIRRLLDPLSRHLLVRTSVLTDHLTYDIDYSFKWEVNLVNYENYSPHAPFGTAYIKILQSKFPEVFTQANSQTGIVFRILQMSSSDLPESATLITLLDQESNSERFFLNPVYLPATNEYIFTMGLKTDFLTRKGSINTYTEEMLNYCLSSTKPSNPSGSWGIEVYKHTIK